MIFKEKGYFQKYERDKLFEPFQICIYIYIFFNVQSTILFDSYISLI